MDQAKARALLVGERARLQRLLQPETGRPQPAEMGEIDDADRRNAEETGTAVDQLLRARWTALGTPADCCRHDSGRRLGW